MGVLLAGVIAQLLPTSLIDGYLGNPLAAMLVMLVVGLPMYVCATASTPIAAALVLQGLNPGAALVFLMVGPATNAANLSMVSPLVEWFSSAVLAALIAFNLWEKYRPRRKAPCDCGTACDCSNA